MGEQTRNDGSPDAPADERQPARGQDAPGGPDSAAFFGFFTEIGIINQLASAILQSRLPDGVTVAQFGILNHLTRVRDGQTPLAMANAFQVPKTSMTHMVAGLEARGLVETRPNPKDGRSKCVWLTEAGRTFQEEAIRRLGGDMARLAKKLDVSAMAAATQMLASVRRVLDEDRD